MARCNWCGAEYDPETRRPMLAGPDGERHPSPYCSMDCEEQGHDNSPAREAEAMIDLDPDD
jgi:hypothetical protein